MMVASRFMVIIATALMIVVSLSLGAVATTPHASQPEYSSMDSPGHDDCDEAGDQDMNSHSCCHGISCTSSGVWAQVEIVVAIIVSISQPAPNTADHLSGRSIAPETGPPKLLA